MDGWPGGQGGRVAGWSGYGRVTGGQGKVAGFDSKIHGILSKRVLRHHKIHGMLGHGRSEHRKNTRDFFAADRNRRVLHGTFFAGCRKYRKTHGFDALNKKKKHNQREKRCTLYFCVDSRRSNTVKTHGFVTSTISRKKKSRTVCKTHGFVIFMKKIA